MQYLAYFEIRGGGVFFVRAKERGVLDKRDILDLIHGRNRMTIDPGGGGELEHPSLRKVLSALAASVEVALHGEAN